LLADGNKKWCAAAGGLILIIAKKSEVHPYYGPMDLKKTNGFDTGMAAGQLALQGSMLGIVVHYMAGFDYAAAATQFIAEAGYDVNDYDILAMGAYGKAAPVSEDARSNRRPIAESFFKDAFPAK